MIATKIQLCGERNNEKKATAKQLKRSEAGTLQESKKLATRGSSGSSRSAAARRWGCLGSKYDTNLRSG